MFALISKANKYLHFYILKDLKNLNWIYVFRSNWKERVVSLCLENQIAVYSPHTAWDSVTNGINDWLILPFNNKIPDSIRAIKPHSEENPKVGAGRIFKTPNALPYTVENVISTIKRHLKLDHIQISMGCNQTRDSHVKEIGVCAGSGGSLLKNISPDVFITGEMSHHDLLDAAHRGITVIVCNHSNTERGYLDEFISIFNEGSNLGPIKFLKSDNDKDPLNLQ